ncbi:hypothetical protein MHBO_004204 [Bonamia ostreae]|uniref:Uncharacterized protein n=1 Tax=Bonamia ostreae TaxID=126728 RepID=A0ABV2ASQ1_9EUKA
MSLKTRKYIGPTSTDTKLAFFMMNQGLVTKGKFVYDPFVGTGSILLAAASRGAFVFGSDIDVTTLKQKPKLGGKTIFENFLQYEFEKPEVFLSDFSKQFLRMEQIFDAIICDPPYGIRAGAKKIVFDKEIKVQKFNV